MKRKLRYCVGLSVCFVALMANVKAEEAFAPWRCSANAGVNVLNCYLQAHGKRVAYSDLLKQKEQAGSIDSAVAITSAAAAHGVQLQPVSLTMKGLESCQLPLIVHVDGEVPGEGTFLLLLAFADNVIHYLNGASATFHSMSKEDFRRGWSGVALLPKRDRRQDLLFYFVGLGGGFLLAAGAQVYLRKTNR